MAKKKQQDKCWWKERLVYQIYPRSFQDSNGDGVGDIPGIISRLDELKDFGVGIIWLSPVYASPDADNGYDISDYRSINPKFGTMADMDRLLKEAEKRDIKIVMDLVINHTSDEHEWFKKSRMKEELYTDYYIWRPGKADGSPPNNWSSFFMSDCWEYDEGRGEYYLHLFDKKQPDLNYYNPKVIEEVKALMRFWLDKGVAGFRCDVINIIYKTSLDDGKWKPAVCGLEHYKSQPGCHAILRELNRDVWSQYDCFTVGETVMVDVEEAKELCDADRKELDMLFYFEHLEVDRWIARYLEKPFRAKNMLRTLDKWQNGLEWNATYLENHDQPRIVSHYGNDKEYWARSAKMLATLQFTLRGTPYVYQGQEIGMTNFDFQNLGQLNDVESHNMDKLLRRYGFPKKLRWRTLRVASRDNARTPVQWTAEEGAGFTTGKPWLGINGNHKTINFAVQKDDPDSVYNYYKKMVRFRAGSDLVKYGGFRPLMTKGKLIGYERELDGEALTVLVNFGKRPVTTKYQGEIVVSNIDRATFDGRVGPYEAVVLKAR